jgi:hypothetical protein
MSMKASRSCVGWKTNTGKGNDGMCDVNMTKAIDSEVSLKGKYDATLKREVIDRCRGILL